MAGKDASMSLPATRKVYDFGSGVERSVPVDPEGRWARWQEAKKTEAGDNWTHRKTNAPVIVLQVQRFDVQLLHPSGRKTWMQIKALGYNYNKVKVAA